MPDGAHSFVRAEGNPALAACRATAAALTAYAAEHPGPEAAEWAFVAQERVAECTYRIDEGAGQDELQGLADAARGELAALTLGLLDEAGPMTAERLAALDADTLALLTWYAAPWPVRWLWPPETDAHGVALRPRIVNLFHGPGGWSEGICRVLGADVDMIGVDLDPGAAATANAAGHVCIVADVAALDPEHPALQWVVGVILSPPCQAFSPAGRRRGHEVAAIELVCSVIRSVGGAAGYLQTVHADGSDAGCAPRSGETWPEVRAQLAGLEDERAGLMAEAAIWPLAMLCSNGSVEWVAVEQSSALPAEIEEAIFFEFEQAGWRTTEAMTLDSVEHGSPSHRKRRFLTAYRNQTPVISVHPETPFPVTTFAQCVGWGPGRRVNTRGQRGIDPRTGRPKGGGGFSADQPSNCVTATAYGWKDEDSGQRIHQNDIGRLVGFRSDYPWTHIGRGEGIRTRAQQAADVVCPMTAAAVIGRILNLHWEEQTRTYVTKLYDTAETA
ncbi:DNA cytosine methyltransferase [Streptomyces sp. ID05-04B]|uniref:DNA cytosine methyltransferase n=1 Tax=Streptomyces sp. ID05-04B TaxID=3028661 RepID=UPI0029C288A6|nr:DNA cytosine methyltransferase [Streptomyces sp. ID05-04B]MDX5563654.1 DNA cytosine methyltransferase [Streptomyces sp. ID05-04B]